MRSIASYSVLLITGILLSQILELESVRPALNMLTLVALGYIMIQVGLEFSIDKRRLGTYGLDYFVASLAAGVPWILCTGYFILMLATPWREALLVGRFAAPTSAGLLLALMAAAGLRGTWVFGKARVLAVFDDVDTVFFMVPFQIILMGVEWACVTIVAVIGALLLLAYHRLHVWRLPSSAPWLLFYGLCIYFLTIGAEHANLVHHFEVLVPAFVLGCVLRGKKAEEQGPETSSPSAVLDFAVKAGFMLLVGLSLRPIELSVLSPRSAAMHTTALFLLGLIGKLVPVFFYGQEATIRERLALCVAMFPRGEVGAGVLIIALGHGFTGAAATLGALSLAANMLVTGLFVVAVRRILRGAWSASPEPRTSSKAPGR